MNFRLCLLIFGLLLISNIINVKSAQNQPDDGDQDGNQDGAETANREMRSPQTQQIQVAPPLPAQQASGPMVNDPTYDYSKNRPEIKLLLQGDYAEYPNGSYDFPASVVYISDGPACRIVVETGFASDTKSLLHALSAMAVHPNSIAIVVTSHYHPDHYGNANLFSYAKHMVGAFINHDAHLEPVKWDQDNSTRLCPNVQLITMKGHTKQDNVVLVRNATGFGDVTITGDLFHSADDFKNERLWSNGAFSADDQRIARQRIISVSDYIIPGHGAPFNVTEEMRRVQNAPRRFNLSSTNDLPKNQPLQPPPSIQSRIQALMEKYQLSNASVTSKLFPPNQMNGTNNSSQFLQNFLATLVQNSSSGDFSYPHFTNFTDKANISGFFRNTFAVGELYPNMTSHMKTNMTEKMWQMAMAAAAGGNFSENMFQFGKFVNFTGDDEFTDYEDLNLTEFMNSKFYNFTDLHKSMNLSNLQEKFSQAMMMTMMMSNFSENNFFEKMTGGNFTDKFLHSNFSDLFLHSNLSNMFLHSNLSDILLYSNLTNKIMNSNLAYQLLYSNLTDKILNSNFTEKAAAQFGSLKLPEKFTQLSNTANQFLSTAKNNSGNLAPRIESGYQALMSRFQG